MRQSNKQFYVIFGIILLILVIFGILFIAWSSENFADAPKIEVAYIKGKDKNAKIDTLVNEAKTKLQETYKNAKERYDKLNTNQKKETVKPKMIQITTYAKKNSAWDINIPSIILLKNSKELIGVITDKFDDMNSDNLAENIHRAFKKYVTLGW